MNNERTNKSINIDKICFNNYVILSKGRKILYLLKGESEISFKKETFSISCGNIVIVDKEKEFQISSLKKDCTIIKIDLLEDKDIIKEFFDKFKKSSYYISDVSKIKLNGQKRRKIEQIIDLMLFDDEEDTEYKENQLLNYLRIIFTEILNLDNNERETAESKLRSKFSVVVSYIEENYNKKIYLEELADLLHYETSYFSKLFKKVLGVGFSEYMQDVRLKKAEKLLEETDYSVEDISSIVGYQDKKQLYKLFRESSNITPGAFRKIGK